MSTCPQCGTTYPSHVSICAHDGTVLAAPEPATDPVVGTVIAGKYRIDAVLGRGGMGAVYRATHVMLNKTVAVKTINRDLIESTEMVQRFQREARAATSLEHPNIVAVYDLGQAEDGALYIAMEFVKGVNLKDAIRASGPMPAGRVVGLLTQVASALARAHRNHIVHRDLKPQNLVIATDPGGHERIKLLDFGIAKTLEEGATQLTAAGYSLGTPHYMAPEQAMGGEIDGRADLYALGVILYEMLVGEVPFNASSAPAVLVKHMNEAPEPPSRRRPDLQIPPALEAIALRCLEKDPARRFQTAEEFGAALERALPAGAATDAGVSSDGATVAVVANRPTAPTAAAARTGVPPPVAALGTPTSAAAATPPPPPLPVQAAGTRPTMKAGAVAPVPAPVTPSTGGGRGRRIIAVVLAIAALFFVALALGGYAAYRAWTSRTADITAEGVASDPAPPSVPAMATETTTPAVSETSAEGAAGAAAGPGQPPPPGPSARPDPSGGATAAGGVATASRPAASRSPRGAAGEPSGQPAAQHGVAGTSVGGTPSAPPASALPKEPPVYFECTGVPDVCGAFTTAFEQAIERKGLPHASDPDRAEILVNARATLLDTRQEEQYGTTFSVQTFSLEVRAESSRDGAAIPMPAAKTFSFDRRFGRERAAEQGRLMAGEALDGVQKFWARKLGG